MAFLFRTKCSKHGKHLREVFNMLNAILFANKKESELCMEKLEYLLFNITPDGLKWIQR